MGERMEPLLSGKATDPGRRRIIGCFLKRCCGASAPVRRPELMRAGSSAPFRELEQYFSTVSSVPLSGGCRRDFLIVLSACYPTIAIDRSYRWTGQSCTPTPRLPGRKKGLLRPYARMKVSDAHMSGLTRTIVARTDAIGKLIRFVILPGPSHDLSRIGWRYRCSWTLWISRHGSATRPVTQTPCWIGLRNTESRR